MRMHKDAVRAASALLLLGLPTLSNCAGDAYLKQIAAQEGITVAEAQERRNKGATEIDEAIPGVGNAFITTYHGD